jgi:glucuronate isomerase
MACEDGLVMTLHPGVRRGHHQPTTEAYGADVGTDIPVPVELTDALRPLLTRYGTYPNLQLVLFTLDETVFSREIGPLAGFYPSVYAGFVAQLVAEHRLGEDEALEVVHDLVVTNPRKAFKL